jgi:hypothetical protein
MKSNFAERNLGCRRRVITGLNWVFSEVDRAIILEDDCIPDESFFRFCAELLDFYVDDDRVMTVCGNNFQRGHKRTEYSYYFSRFMHCWGWATWRRAWYLLDAEMQHWPEVRDNGWLSYLLDQPYAVSYWRERFEQTYQKQIDSWAYAWQFSIWIQSGLNVLPERNLITNTGTGDGATHTKQERWYTNLQTKRMSFPLNHPGFVVRHKAADRFTQRNNYQPTLRSRITGTLKYLLYE